MPFLMRCLARRWAVGDQAQARSVESIMYRNESATGATHERTADSAARWGGERVESREIVMSVLPGVCAVL